MEDRAPLTESAIGTTVLNYSADAVWAEIRDFNSYPAYIDGVTESHLEDEKRGDEVGAVRRFVYKGYTTRQTLTGHSDAERWFTHAGCEPLDWPFEGESVGPVEYTNRVHVRPVTDGNRSFLEWSLEFKSTSADDLKHWKRYFEDSIPVWLVSLRRYLDTYVEGGSPARALIVGLTLKAGVKAADYERFAREVDKPTVERDLPSLSEWHVYRAKELLGATGEAPFDYIEVVTIADIDQLPSDLASETAAKLGAGLSNLVEPPVIISAELVV